MAFVDTAITVVVFKVTCLGFGLRCIAAYPLPVLTLLCALAACGLAGTQ